VEKKKPTILVVDDEDLNLRVIEAMLLPLNYEVVLARDGEEALAKVRDISPDVILLDIMMPKLDGFEVARRLKEGEKTKTIPVVMVTALSEVNDRVKALQAGADDFLSKPVEKTELRARVQSLLKVKAYNDHLLTYQSELETEVAKRTEQLRQAFERIKAVSLETVYRLSRAAEYRDEDTGAHLQRMSHYAAAVSRHMGLDESMVENILYAAPMHDVGKIGIPDHILLKPAKLNPDEWEIMKQHAIIGAQILDGSDVEVIKLGEVVARTHHEKWNGSGYPVGLKGEEIPLPGRIAAISDVFDALTSKRPYKGPFSLEKSFSIIQEDRGKHFDPDVVDAFFSLKDEIIRIHEMYKDKNESLLVRMVGTNKNKDRQI
jgi:putative two-component system response regulator